MPRTETYELALLFSHASRNGRIIPPALSAAYYAALDCAVGLVAVSRPASAPVNNAINFVQARQHTERGEAPNLLQVDTATKGVCCIEHWTRVLLLLLCVCESSADDQPLLRAVSLDSPCLA